MAQEAKVGETVQTGSEKLGEDIDRLKADVRRITETLEKLAGDSASSATAALKSKARQARAGAARAQEVAAEGLEDAVAYARTTIAERPLGTVAAALGVGVLLGLVLRRR